MFRFPFFIAALFLSVCLNLMLHAADPAQREWKDKSGKVLAVGEFISLMDGEVCLMTPNGTGKTIAVDKLCDADRRFAENNGEDLAKIEGSLPDVEEIGVKKLKDRPTPMVPTLPTSNAPINPDIDIVDNDVIAESGSGIDLVAGRGDIQTKVKDEKDKYAGQKRVVMFDFESLWDADQESRYGQIMGNMFWLKLNREKGFIIPESMIDVRNICEMQNIKPNPETPLTQMKDWVTKTFNSDIGIWGKIERVDKDVMEIYDFWMKIVDFSVDPPRVIYEVSKARTDAIAEVTGIYVRSGMDKLYDRQARTKAEQAAMQANWDKNPNLMEGGDFERTSGGIPVGWESRCAQHREPIGRLVQRVPDPDNPKNHYLHTEFDAGIGEGFGLMYYSKPFPIEEGATYRLDYRYRLSKGVNCIVFVKCYDVMDTEFKPTAGALKEGFNDKIGQQTREVYRNQQNHQQYPISGGGPNQKEIANAGKWVQHSEEFTPRHTRFSPKLGRVMLFGFVTAGSIDYDDFVLKKVKDADPAELRAKITRHSLDSKVTLKEMEENERRGQEKTREMRREREQGPKERKQKTKIK